MRVLTPLILAHELNAVDHWSMRVNAIEKEFQEFVATIISYKISLAATRDLTKLDQGVG